MAARRMRSRAVGAVVLVATSVLITSCSTGSNSVVVQTLWYGSQADQQGVTPVTIEAQFTKNPEPIDVNLEGFADSGTDAQWNASAWTGATLATLMSGLNPDGVRINFEVSESIGGPSAGGLMTAGTIAALAGVPVRDDFAATGTVLPDGTIGPVYGIPDKLKAARDAGFKTVAYPKADQLAVDRATGLTVNVEELAQNLGIEAIGVGNVTELAELLAPAVDRPREADPAPPNPQMLAIIRQAAEQSLARIERPTFAVTAAETVSPEQLELARQLEATKKSVPALLRRGDDFTAFSEVTLTERSVLRWNAEQQARSSARADPRSTQRQLLESAKALATEIERASQASAANAKVTMVEQLAAVPDALSWGNDAQATVEATAQVLSRSNLDAVQLGNQAADLSQARYDANYYLPTAVAAATAVGVTPIVNLSASEEVLGAYAHLLTEAGDANLDYVAAQSSTESSDLQGLPDRQLAEILKQRTHERQAADGATGSATLVASTALSYYTQTVAFTASLAALRGNANSDSSSGRIVIEEQSLFSDQLRSADLQATQQVRIGAGAQLDPSYLEWGRQWGTSIASTSERRAPTDAREGLVYIWYSTTAGRLMMALANSQTSAD